MTRPHWVPPPQDISFAEARYGLLATMAEELGEDLLAIIREYKLNAEFKRRIDLAALNMSCPTSEAVH
jgi:ferritin-like metal-binding protein YciE